MIRVKAIKDFTLQDYQKVKNVEHTQKGKPEDFFENDTFECNKTMAEYLLGKNPIKATVVEIIEIIPTKRC